MSTCLQRFFRHTEVSYRTVQFTALLIQLPFMVFKVSFSWVNAVSYYPFLSWCMMCHLFKRTFWCLHELNLETVLRGERVLYIETALLCQSRSRFIRPKRSNCFECWYFSVHLTVFTWTFFSKTAKASQEFAADEQIYHETSYFINIDRKLLSV